MRTKIYSTSTLTAEQLSLFLAANGLGVDSGELLTPAGARTGFVAGADGVFCLTLCEDGYTADEIEVKAWWPGFRAAWIVVGAHEPEEIGPTLGPDEVVCDLCNATIVTRPVPVVNTDALCPKCFERTGLPFPGSIPLYIPEMLRSCICVEA
jgi:hypothetical protein